MGHSGSIMRRGGWAVGDKLLSLSVRQHEGASFTSEYLRLNTPKQKFGGLLGVGDLAHPAKKIPSDFKRTFNESW